MIWELLHECIIVSTTIIFTRIYFGIVGEYNSIFGVVGQIMQDNNGVRGLYRGLIPSVLGIVPYAGIDLMIFFTLKERWMSLNKNQQKTPGVLTLVSHRNRHIGVYLNF